MFGCSVSSFLSRLKKNPSKESKVDHLFYAKNSIRICSKVAEDMKIKKFDNDITRIKTK